ncbi:hypothetical protein DSO57_1014174 [Entomophthora muscae]|uniref:Uncharacterized protein n=1 Tax=Entomophthora muscae TaxID=34485 RepID=A0ACC2TTM1_9FUNG|nr:hypothetical protein DSO57_1014174 [Entomophthora muscae]
MHSLLGFCSQSLVNDHICYCNDKFHNVTVFENLEVDSRAVVGVDQLNSLIVVAYRQSISPANWKLADDTELVSYPTPRSKEKVHKGILKYFQSVQQATEDRVLELFDIPQYEDYTLHITGYGMGGTAAIISMSSWIRLLQKNRINNRSQFYAYSSFRPGNLAFAQYIESLKMPLVRYTRKGDIVPHLPNQNMTYTHAGQEFYDSEDAPFSSPHLIKCSSKALEDLHCSLNNTEFSATSHLFPFNKPIPGFPIC